MRNDLSFTIRPIGYIESPYKEKFAVPRQPGLVPSSRGFIHLYAPYDNSQAFSGLELFSHIWVSFYFHECPQHDFLPMVRPPRLGGSRKMGVFATRSPIRPNSMGLSVITLIKVHNSEGHTVLEVSGFDLVDKTPILDIKPYIPFADSIPDALGGFAQQTPELMDVVFSAEALADLAGCPSSLSLEKFISEVLAQDPRPAYHDAQQEAAREYGVKLYDYNVTWTIENHTAAVKGIKPTQREYS
jgi:tRNA-Thr(GGU) m(6)t(6)A37 methyltransferase TsaA